LTVATVEESVSPAVSVTLAWLRGTIKELKPELSEIAPAKPFRLVRVSVIVAEAPGGSEGQQIFVGLGEIVKSGLAANVAGAALSERESIAAIIMPLVHGFIGLFTLRELINILYVFSLPIGISGIPRKD
jgi:hypothetical protein